MTSAADPPGWAVRLNQRDARRRERCRRCGVRGNKSKLVATEAGMFCRPHADALPPRIARHDHDQDHESMDDIAAAERRAELARAHLRAVRRGAEPADGATIHAAELELQRALNAAAAAWAAQLVQEGGDAS